MTDLSDYERKPKKARTTTPLRKAWWYACRKGIEIYIHTPPNGPTVHCRITKRQLRRYLEQMDGKP